MAEYVYQEYPRLLYKGDEAKRVNNDDEKRAALKDGFALVPGAVAEPEPEPVLEPVAEDEPVEEAPKKKPGRPKKAE